MFGTRSARCDPRLRPTADRDEMAAEDVYDSMNVPELKAEAERRGIKQPGVGWPTCCPPKGLRDDIIRALRRGRPRARARPVQYCYDDNSVSPARLLCFAWLLLLATLAAMRWTVRAPAVGAWPPLASTRVYARLPASPLSPAQGARMRAGLLHGILIAKCSAVARTDGDFRGRGVGIRFNVAMEL